jgi:hypothetical protein
MSSGASPITVAASSVRVVVVWAVCLVALAAGTGAAFRGVDAWARGGFAEHRRHAPSTVSRIGEVVGSLPLASDVVVRQEIDVEQDGLAGLRVRTVTWGADPSSYDCNWSLVEVSADGRSLRTVRSGTFPTAAATDWGYVDLRFEPIAGSLAARYALRITIGPESPVKPLGLPLFQPVGTAVEVSVRRRRGEPPAIPRPATLDVRLVHAGEGA